MGKSGFSSLGKKIRDAEKELTKGLVKWKLKREGRPLPDEKVLDKGSKQIVEEAHKMVKKQGKSLFKELKHARNEFMKAYNEDDKKKD